MTIAKYIRLSSADEATRFGEKEESNSIVNQRRLLDSYIAASPEFAGWRVLEFQDDGKSGTNLDRPGIQALLAQARQGEIDCVIVKDLSRLGRNHLDTDDLLGMVFPFLQIRFISLNDMYDSALQVYGTAGDIDTGMRNIINQMYSQDLSRKVKLAKKQYARRAQSTAAFLVFGYMKSPEDKHSRVPDPVAAEVVRKIFEWYIAGRSTAQIAKMLNAEGTPTPAERQQQLGARGQNWNSAREKTEWDRDKVYRILRDEQYTGKLIACKTEHKDLGGAYFSRRCDPSEWIVIPHAFEGIITQEQFDAAQRQLALSRRGKAGIKAEPGQRESKAAREPVEQEGQDRPLFYRKLKCGICGLAPVHKKAARPYYKCGARAWNSAEGCASVRMYEDEIRKAVLASIRFQAQLARKLRKHMEACERRQHSGKGRKRELLLQKKLDGLDAQRKKLYLDYHVGTLSKAEFDAASEAISTMWREYQQELAAQTAEDIGPDAAICREELDALAKLSNLRSLDREIVDRLIRTTRIFENKRIEIVWNFSSPYAALIEDYERKTNYEGTR